MTALTGPSAGPARAAAATVATGATGAAEAARRDLAVRLLAVLAVLGFVADLALRPGGVDVTRAVDDVGQGLAAAVAATAALVRAATRRGRGRASWLLFGAGCASWALGQATWSALDLGGGGAGSPSVADLGYLLCPVLIGAGLVVRPASLAPGRKARTALDAVAVALALLAVSWAAVLGRVFERSDLSRRSGTVLLAYPVLDVAVLTVAVVVAASTTNWRGLRWLIGGIACFAVADGAYAYLTAVGRYATGSPWDTGWVAGFAAVAVAAWEMKVSTPAGAETGQVPRPAALLPFVPAALAAGVVGVRAALGTDDRVLIGLSGAVTVLLVVRQALTVLDNRALVADLSHRATHDPLTGLANRDLFHARLARALDAHARTGQPVGVALVDLDDFKAVNDSLGHLAGDELLVRASERFTTALGGADGLARLGGDEFAVLAADGVDPAAVAVALRAALEQPLGVGTHLVPIRASVGTVTLPREEPTVTSGEILRRADIALYAAKLLGGDRTTAYDAALDHDAGTGGTIAMRAALVADVHAGRIRLAVQPITGRSGPYGVEALARWHHDGAAVPPDVFLPLARRAGVGVALDLIVLARAVAWAGANPDAGRVSVNLAQETLHEPTLVSRLRQSLLRHGVDPERLTVEVLESGFVEGDETALLTLGALRATGLHVAVDDFGTGYASLARLQELRPDVVKLDRSLVVAGSGGRGGGGLLRGIADLVHHLGAVVVAEGIETPAQLAAARAAGCDAFQGWLLGRPALVDDVEPAVDQCALRS